MEKYCIQLYEVMTLLQILVVLLILSMFLQCSY